MEVIEQRGKRWEYRPSHLCKRISVAQRKAKHLPREIRINSFFSLLFCFVLVVKNINFLKGDMFYNMIV